MSYPTFKQTLLGGSNGFKPTNPLSYHPRDIEGTPLSDRKSQLYYNQQRGAHLNEQQAQRHFNTGYRRLMQQAARGDPRALDAMQRMAPGYQRVGDIGTEQYGDPAVSQRAIDEQAQERLQQTIYSGAPTPQDEANDIRSGIRKSLTGKFGAQPIAPPGVNLNVGEGYTPGSLNLNLPTTVPDPYETDLPSAGARNFQKQFQPAPPPPSNDQTSTMFGQMPNVGYANDLEPSQGGYDIRSQPPPEYGTPDFYRYRDAMNRGAVEQRRQQQVENGVGGMQPLLNPESAQTEILKRLPPTQNGLVPLDQAPTTTQVVPGIGNVVGYDNGTRAMLGKYGTGTATIGGQKPTKERVIEEIDPDTGKKIKMTTTEWFRKSAERQGVANKFAENEAQIRRIMEMSGTKYQPPPPVR